MKYRRERVSDGETENINQNLALLEETYDIYDSMYSKLIFLASQTESRGCDRDTQTQRGKRDGRRRGGNKRQREAR